ncbi:acetyl-CoA synthetase-like protein [Apiospora marii]|uniref:Acetyl-CoA synthetase-like protein n=1 Tax=Apiospora marii TaxID=335849 RepID=A0ABR1R7K4_9PEZI
MANSKFDRLGAVDFVSFAFEAQRDYPPDKPLFIDAQDPGRSLNYAQTRSLVRKLASGLKASGLEKGDRVLLSVANNYLYAALLYGIIGAGGVACGVNPAWKDEELDHVLRQSEATLIVATPDSLPTVLRVANANEISTDRIFLLDDLDAPLDFITNMPSQVDVVDGGLQSGSTQASSRFTDLLRHGESDWLTLDSEQAPKETPAIYYPTSGTSGLPKLAVLSHHNLIMQHLSLYQQVPYHPVVRVLCLPCFHVFGAAWLIGFPLRYGEPAYVMPRFRLEAYVRNLARYGATEAYLTPPIVHMLNKAPASLPVRELFETVRWAGVGGAPIDADALRRFQGAALHPAATLSQVWGMTEVGAACFFRYGDADADPAAVGRMLENYEIKLVGRDSGIEVGVGDQVPAELFVRSPNVMMGYKGTASPQDAGGEWFPTGDLVRVVDGKVYVVGRTKELIKTKGWQVAPAEIEAMILQHPDVRDCAVVGVRSDDGTTEVPRAYIVRKERGDGGWLASFSSLYWRKKKSALGYEVYGLVADRLASYKRLEGGVVFVDAIPRTASGKTQRFKLVGHVEELEGRETAQMAGRSSSAPVVWAQECYAVVKSSLKKAFA